MTQYESEHLDLMRACKRALNAKEKPMTQKRLLELIEEEKKRSREAAQARGKPQGPAITAKAPR